MDPFSKLVEAALGKLFQLSLHEEVDVLGGRCACCLQHGDVHVLEHGDGPAPHPEHNHGVGMQPAYPFRRARYIILYVTPFHIDVDIR